MPTRPKLLTRQAAPLHEEAKDQLFYHGTSSEKAAQAILAGGIQPREISMPDKAKSRAQLAPAQGRVYLTPEIGYAAIYALGGNMFGHETNIDNLIIDRDGSISAYGYIFAIEGRDIQGDILPDEDCIGEFVTHLFSYLAAKHRLDMLSSGVPEKWKGERASAERTIAYNGKDPINQPDAKHVADWLYSVADRAMTEKQHRDIRDGFIGAQAAVGKKIQKLLRPDIVKWMLDHGAHAAHLGAIHPTRAWRFKKRDAAKVQKEDVLSICEEVPVQVAKAAARREISGWMTAQDIRRGDLIAMPGTFLTVTRIMRDNEELMVFGAPGQFRRYTPDDEVNIIRKVAASDVTQSAKFKAWFAGSTVVDESGKPRLLFHGSSERFKDFKWGHTIHLVDDAATAKSYANGYMSNAPGFVYAAYVKMSNPIDLRKPGETQRVLEESDQYVDSELILEPERLFEEFDIDETEYDGIINAHETGGGARDGNAEYVVFNPQQVWIVKTEAVGTPRTKAALLTKRGETPGNVPPGYFEKHEAEESLTRQQAWQGKSLQERIESVLTDAKADAENDERWAGNCTDYALEAMERIGAGGDIWGYSKQENPTARIADQDGEGGHDFAIVGDWIVDPWAMDFLKTPGMIPLSDTGTIQKLYGDRAAWSLLDDRSSKKAKLLTKEAYNEEAWQGTEDEYTGGWSAGLSDEEMKQRWGRNHEWTQAAMAALSLGKITPLEAKQRNWHFPDTKPEEFKPLPEKLYHVTTSADNVFYNGLMSRWEQAMGSGRGLGGGSDKSISFTTDYLVAQQIYEAVYLAQKVAAGSLTEEDLINWAETGTGASHPYVDEFKRGLQSIIGGEDPYGKLLTGVKYRNTMGNPPTNDGEGWKGDEGDYHWTGGDDIERYRRYTRPYTPDEAREARWSAYKAWLWAREQAGGGIDPLFFCTDNAALAKVDPDEIAIFEFKPAPGAMGVQVSGLGEWRTFSGKAVKMVGAVPFQGKKIAFDVKETPHEQEYRERTGYTAKVEVDAAKFKTLWEAQHNGEKLDWNPQRSERLKPLESINAHPLVYTDSTGRLEFLDGRHRVTEAARRGEPIVIAVPEGTIVPDELRAQKKVASTIVRAFYHGTRRSNVEAILRDGLKRSSSQQHAEWGPAIYLTDEIQTAEGYAGHSGVPEAEWEVLKIAPKFLNRNLLRPDDWEFPDVFAETPEEERQGYDNWALCPWEMSLEMCTQVAYLGDIPPSAISVLPGKPKAAASGKDFGPVYHGSAGDFKTFKPSSRGSFGSGIYLTDVKATAEEYADGGTLYTTYVHMNNPLYAEADFGPGEELYDFESEAIPLLQKLFDKAQLDELMRKSVNGDGMFGREVQKRVQELGHDGIVATYEDGGKNYIVYRPNQVRVVEKTKANGAAKVSSEAPKRKSGFIMAEVPSDSLAAKMADGYRDQVDDDDLMGNGRRVGENHITLRYGLFGTDTTAIREYLESIEPFEVACGATKAFDPSPSSDGAAPIIMPCGKDKLQEIHDHLATLGEWKKEDFPDYQPHLTVAYVKPEAVEKYVGKRVRSPQTFTVSQIKICVRDGEKRDEIVELGKRKTAGKTAVGAAALPNFKTWLKQQGGVKAVVGNNSGDLVFDVQDLYGIDCTEQEGLDELFGGECPFEADGYPEPPDKQFYAIVEKGLEKRYNELLAEFQAMGPSFTIYRCIDLKSLKTLRRKSLGIYWTRDAACAESIFSEDNGEDYTFRATCPASSVDWERMMYANLSPEFHEEEEVTLKERAPVEITGWMKGRPSGDKGPWKAPLPEWRRVTASAKTAKTASTNGSSTDLLYSVISEWVSYGETNRYHEELFASKLQKIEPLIPAQCKCLPKALYRACVPDHKEASGYTSWTKSIRTAQNYAATTPGKVVLKASTVNADQVVVDVASLYRYMGWNHPDVEEWDLYVEADQEVILKGPVSSEVLATPSAKTALDVENGIGQTESYERVTNSPQFKAWFAGSKITDSHGRPLVCFHGSTKDFDTFDINQTATHQDTGFMGTGFYFTPKAGVASGYAMVNENFWDDPKPGAQVYPVYLKITNPKFYHEFPMKRGTKEQADALTAKNKGEGHDGAVYVDKDGVFSEIIAYESSQIKSAIGNGGKFDPDDTRITASTKSAVKGTESARAAAEHADGDLYSRINSLREDLLDAAFNVLAQEEESMGFCVGIADAFAALIKAKIPGVRIEKRWRGVEHVFLIPALKGEKVVVDLPYRLYETRINGGWWRRNDYYEDIPPEKLRIERVYKVASGENDASCTIHHGTINDSSQIKSAIGNGGKFDPADTKITATRKRPALQPKKVEAAQ